MKNNIYIHYGSKEFDKNRFLKIRNRDGWVKPFGGLWASNVKAEFGWKDWLICESYWNDKVENEFNQYYKNGYFLFKLYTDKILTIKSDKQLDEIMLKYKSNTRYTNEFSIFKILDFEKLANDYDAIEIIISNDYKLNMSLAGWDCDSILVFNPDIIEVVKDEIMAL